MRLSNTRWTFSPTDLATFVRCEHAIRLRNNSRHWRRVMTIREVLHEIVDSFPNRD